MKNSQEMVRASLLPLFNNIAEDLNQTVQNLEQRRYSHIKGTLQRGTTSLAYVHMVLLPVLSSMLDHLGKNNYGVDVFGNLRSPPSDRHGLEDEFRKRNSTRRIQNSQRTLDHRDARNEIR